MRLAAINVRPLEIAYPRGGYTMSHVHLTRLTHRAIRIETDTGVIGHGEIARRSAADPVESMAAEDTLLSDLQDLPLADLPLLLDQWRRMDDPSNKNRVELAVASAVELAWYDLAARMQGIPLSSFLGGPATGRVPGYLSLSSADPAEMAAKVRARPGHRVIQAKLGVGDLTTDLERVRSVLAEMTPDQNLLADFNGALDVDTACRSLADLRDPRLTWEDPCQSYDDNAAVAHAVKTPVMFDMCMSSLAVFARACAEGIAGSVVIKPPFVGGLSVARSARELCRASGMRHRIDGPWCGPVAASANIHLALGADPDLLISSADLMDPFEIDNPLVRQSKPGCLSPVPGAGVGPVPPEFAA